MKPRLPKLGVEAGVLALMVVMAATLQAQVTGGSLSGTITGSAGAAVANAKISVKNVATDQTVEAESNSAGMYSVPKLAPGDYDVSVSAPGFGVKTERVELAAGARQTLDIALTPASALPQAPAPQAPSLSELGFPATQTRPNPEEQARLDKRTHMLKVHQRLGLITAAPMLATVIVGGMAGGRSTSSTTRDVHAGLGAGTAALYFTTAYFAIRAPKISGTKTYGPIRLHKALAWIHGPGMVLTPILGAMAFQQKSRGERVHGIASAHGAVAYTTAIAYGAALLSVSVKF
jgi:hypothetical protein